MDSLYALICKCFWPFDSKYKRNKSDVTNSLK